ncbi:sugar ABC transporter permease [Vallitalea pronyensis]|uniref:Sugar ABC transporter permease n=1 Tax=Vallitalea pronyensis TaxID=1348613 RepID=A0A8J8MH37_9FIRM|nr:sugar ABC transporter permease [Vallitalea pronyensis]QUI21213.1 sugar ABC transporter permease [Vallitalea pronyensis]
MGQTKKKKKINWTAWLFIGPNYIGFIVFILIPVVFSLIVSFTDFNIFKGLSGMRFVGFDNIKEMFSDVWFTSAVKNNLLFILGTIPVLIMVSMVVATILNNKVYLKNTMRAIVFLPYISSVVAISVVWMKLYNPSKGQINQLLMWFGMDNPPSWLASTTWALPALMLVGIWMGLGYNIVVYMAGLQTIDRALYESAQIDGANGVQMFRHITVPMLSSTTFFLMITNIIGSFQTFGTVNIMTDGGPGKASTVIAQYIYVAGFRYHKMGYAAAMAWVLLIFIFCITLFQWKLQKRYENNF